MDHGCKSPSQDLTNDLSSVAFKVQITEIAWNLTC